MLKQYSWPSRTCRSPACSGAASTGENILARQILGIGRLFLGAGIGQRDQGRREVKVCGHGLAALAARVGGMGDDQRHVVLLAVGGGALAGQMMGAVEFAVVRVNTTMVFDARPRPPVRRAPS
jgi:hypothetical protein